MAVRPVDFTAQIKAEQALMEQRAEQRRKEDEAQEKKIREMTARQATAYGTVVLAVAKTRFDVDQLAGLLTEAIERADADHRLPEVWRERGPASFRGPAPAARRARSAEQHPAGDDVPGPRRDNGAGNGNGHANGPERRQRAAGRQHGPNLRETLQRELRICWAALRRIGQARNRRRRHEALAGYRDWRQQRRDRTRLLIEYGGLVVKAGLADRVDDDRATLLGAFLALRDLLDGHGDNSPADLKLRWRRRGLRTFDADAVRKEEDDRKEAGAVIVPE